MGMCYDIMFKAKVKNEEKAVKALWKFIDNRDADFNIDAFAKLGIGTESFDDLVRIIFAAWPYNNFYIEEEEGWIVYTNDFNASYGWFEVMIDAFDVMTPYLENGSNLIIDGDSSDDHWERTVRNGKAV